MFLHNTNLLYQIHDAHILFNLYALVLNGTCAYQRMSEILLEHTYFSVKQFLKNKINYLKSRFEGANIFIQMKLEKFIQRQKHMIQEILV